MPINKEKSVNATLMWFGPQSPRSGTEGPEGQDDPSHMIDPRAQMTTLGWHSALPEIVPLSPVPGTETEAETKTTAETEIAAEIEMEAGTEILTADEVSAAPVKTSGVQTEQLPALPRSHWPLWAGAGLLAAGALVAGLVLAALAARAGKRDDVPPRSTAVAERATARVTPTATAAPPQAVAERAASEPGDGKAQKLAALEREVKALAAQLAVARKAQRRARVAAVASPPSKPGLRVQYDRKNNVVDVWLPPAQVATPVVQVNGRRPVPQEKDEE